MVFEVELDMFSGLPNPRWLLTDGEAADFTEQIGDQAAPIVPVGTGEDKLGYRGFIIRATEDDAAFLADQGLPPQFRVRDGLDPEMAPEGATEALLASSASTAGVLWQAADEAMWEATEDSAPQLDGDVLGRTGVCSLYYTDFNNFDFWNGDRKYYNNCYNYASNYASGNFAQPGYKSGTPFYSSTPKAPWESCTVTKVKNAAIRDGWVTECDGSNLTIALVIAPGVDYHFYRKNLNDNGVNRWCHKPGHTKARNYDNDGNFITNPQNCSRSPYDTWGGRLYSDGVRKRVVTGSGA